MKLFVVAAFFAVASAAKLDKNYLPPGSAQTAGGSGNFLATPFGSAGSPGSFGSPSSASPAFSPSGAAGHPSGVFGGNVGGFGGKTAGAGGFNGNVAGGSGTFGGPVEHGKLGGASGSGSHDGAGRYSGFKSAEAGAAIIRFNNVNNGDGSYQFEYDTENKISQNEAGQLKNAGSENEAEEVHGSYSYISPEGQTITVNYIANEYGFQPSGDHLPTSPPIPEAILKSLEQIAAAGPAAGGYSGDNNGQYQASNVNNQFAPSGQASFNSQSGYRY